MQQLINNALWLLNMINQAVLNGQHSINDSLSVRGEIVVLVTDVEVVVVCDKAACHLFVVTCPTRWVILAGRHHSYHDSKV